MEDSNLEKKEQFESSLKKYLGIIPHLSFIVIILGFIKQSLYYKNFNISIKNFTSLSELGLIIADDLFLIVFSLMIIFGLAELLTKHILNKLGTKL